MAGSNASEVIFISVNHSITLMGKVWLIVMILLRIVVLLLAGYPLYQDEQERFVCNTIQPGCANVCYDLFSPISLFRFWLVQLVSLCLPYIIFIIYVVHKVLNSLTVDLVPEGQLKALPLLKIHHESFRKMSGNKMPRVVERGMIQCFTGAYILHLMFRTALEAAFGAAHYYLFGFYIPRRFLCQHPPCTTQVDCYISRPTEKTVMLNFMQGSKSSFVGETLSSGQEPLSTSSPGPLGCNTNGNNGYSVPQGEALDRDDSELALCPPEPMGTPRSIRISKRNRLKPPPPPRRDLGSSHKGSKPPTGDVTITTCTRRVGQYSLVELGSSPEIQTNEDMQEKRSEWV
ncbi:gap junction delta-4 protein [Xyrichtys novacula]|uniref:Gap junction protein n=1 Tax=Xyrichtys novacula TaxID=13765 RepID=A0AAV1H6Y7_XYRNO|nr:gap junction delta-4 protein [Xyrichtys novacula]